MKKCLDHNSENRPTTWEILKCLLENYDDRIRGKKEIIDLADKKSSNHKNIYQIQRIIIILYKSPIK